MRLNMMRLSSKWPEGKKVQTDSTACEPSRLDLGRSARNWTEPDWRASAQVDWHWKRRGTRQPCRSDLPFPLPSPFGVVTDRDAFTRTVENSTTTT